MVVFAQAGAEERGDILIKMERMDGSQSSVTEKIEVKSKYDSLFGEHLSALLQQLYRESAESNLSIRAADFGAWDYTVKARFEVCLQKVRGEPA